MSQIKKFNYTQSKITAILVDSVTSNRFLWVAFEGSSGSTRLEKRSAFDPGQVFFEIDLPIDKISRMTQDSSNIYLAVDDSSNIGYKISKTNPLTIQTALSLPSGINEAPVDIGIDGSVLYYLIPGVISGEVPKVVVTSTSGILDEIVDLQLSGFNITDASGLTVADTGDVWVVTNTSPVILVRMFPDGGGSFNLQAHEII